MAKPWISRTVSAEPPSGPTVETRKRTSVFFPVALRKLADVISVHSWVHSNTPCALFDGSTHIPIFCETGCLPGCFGMNDTGMVSFSFNSCMVKKRTALESFRERNAPAIRSIECPGAKADHHRCHFGLGRKCHFWHMDSLLC